MTSRTAGAAAGTAHDDGALRHIAAVADVKVAVLHHLHIAVGRARLNALGQVRRGADDVALVQVAAGDLHIVVVGVALGDGDLLKGHIDALSAGLAQHVGAAVVVGAHGVARDGKDVVLGADDDLDLGGNADQQTAVLPVDRDGSAEAAAVVGDRVDTGQGAGDGVVRGIAGDVALQAGLEPADGAGRDRDFHRQVVHILNRGHRAAAHRAHRGVQRGDRAVHRGSQGAVLQRGLQIGQGVVLALGLRELRLGVVHAAGRACRAVLIGLLRLLQRLAVLLNFIVGLADGVKALQAQFRDAALALGDIFPAGVIRDLALQAVCAGRVAVLLGLGQLNVQVGKGVLVPGDLLGVAGVPVGDDLTVRLAAVGGGRHRRIVVINAQRVVVLLRLIEIFLRRSQVCRLILDGLGVVLSGVGPGVAELQLRVGDLLFHVGGVQRGDDIALPDRVTDSDVDCRDLVGLDGIRRRDAGAAAGLDRAGHADRIAQGRFGQHGGAHELIAAGGGLVGLAQHVHEDEGRDQHNDQKDRQLFVAFDPAERAASGLCFFCHTGFPSVFGDFLTKFSIYCKCVGFLKEA